MTQKLSSLGRSWILGLLRAMIVLSWNCRGLGHPRAVLVLLDLIKAHKPDIILLLENLSYSNKVENIRISLGFDGVFSIDREGSTVGICALWKTLNLCSVVGYSKHHMDLEVLDNGASHWILTDY